MLARDNLAEGALLLGLSGLACGNTVEVNDTTGGNGGDGGTGGDGGATVITATATAAGGGGEGGGGGTGTSSTPFDSFCKNACEVLVEGSCFSEETCQEYCSAESGDWPAEVGEAFATCAAENPLCFETVEGCILSVLHPPGSDNTARLKGAGLEEYDGKVVRVWHDPETGVMFGGEAVIAGGEFAFEWTEPFQTWDGSGPLLLFYIDMDENGMCDAAADLTGSPNLSWNGDYLEPVYEATVSPPLNDPDFVCNFTP